MFSLWHKGIGVHTLMPISVNGNYMCKSQVPVHWDENLRKDFKICICIAFGYEETKSIVVVLTSLNLVGISCTWNNRPWSVIYSS